MYNSSRAADTIWNIKISRKKGTPDTTLSLLDIYNSNNIYQYDQLNNILFQIRKDKKIRTQNKTYRIETNRRMNTEQIKIEETSDFFADDIYRANWRQRL
jgi:hypothetical protein